MIFLHVHIQHSKLSLSGGSTCLLLANTCRQIQYDDGDQETGAVFNRYSLEQSHDGHQVVKVHEFKPGKYVPRAAHVEDDDGAALTSTTKQLVQDMSVPGMLGGSRWFAPAFVATTCLLLEPCIGLMHR